MTATSILEKEYITTAEFARICDVPERTIRWRIKQNQYHNLKQTISPKGTLKYRIPVCELPPEILKRLFDEQNRVEASAAREPDNADEFDLNEANEKWGIIGPVVSGETTAKERAEQTGIPARTIQRWAAAYRESGTGAKMRALTRKKRRDRGHFRNLDSEIAAAFKKMYLTPEQRSVKTCFYYLSNIYGDRMPSYPTLMRYAETIPEDLKTRMRHGEKKWRDRHEPIVRRDLNAYNVAEIYCGDHHEMDVLVEHEGRLVRPWLTAWLDFRTAAITGWHISTQPNSRTIALALAESIRISADGIGGIPETVYIDNGKDYRSHKLNGRDIRKDVVKRLGSIDFDESAISFFTEYGIKRTFAKPYLARSKGPIERWFGTMEGGFGKFLPGYLAAKAKDRPEELQKKVNAFYKGERGYFIGLGDLRSMFEAWLWEDYHNKVQSRVGDTPVAAWEKNKGTIRTISEKSLQVALWPKDEAVIQQSGVEKFGTRSMPRYFYHEDVPKYVGKTVVVRYNPEDISVLYAYTLEGEYLFPLTHRPLVGTETSEQNYQQFMKEQARERKRMRAEMERIRNEGPEFDPMIRWKNRNEKKKNKPAEPQPQYAKAVGADIVHTTPKYENLKAPEATPAPAMRLNFFKFQAEESKNE